MALSRITEAVASFTDLTIGDDLTLTDDLLMASDANIIKFGADADVTLTHVHNTGLLLNSTSVIQFNDASQNIGAPSATVLDINATDEIELNATLVDVNANLDVSGTIVSGGTLTATTSIGIGSAVLTEAELEFLDGITAGTAAASKALILDGSTNISGIGTIGSGAITSSSTIQGTTITATTAFVPDASDGAALGTTSLEFSDLFLADAAVINLGADQDVTLTHVADTGILLNSSRKIQFSDAAESIHSDGSKLILTSNSVAFSLPTADGSSGQTLVTNGSGVLSFATASANTPSSADGQALGSASLEWSDLFLADASTIQFGADQDVTLTHVADTGLLLNTTMVIQFRDSAINIGSPADGDLDINADDEIELNSTLIDINGNVEISGTAAITGIATFTDDIIIGDGKTIGVTSDADAITIASNGQLTLTQTLIGTALDISGDIDVDGTTNLDVVDIDGAVDMASTLQVDGAITSSAGATITTADNNAQLTLVSTDADANAGPELELYRNSASPADNDFAGTISFQAENDAGEKIEYGVLKTRVIDASDGTEDFRMTFEGKVGGSDVQLLKMDNSNIVFNEDSQDIDFRVEGNGNTHALFVDGGNDKVAIGNSNPNDFGSLASDLVIGTTSGEHGLTIVTGTSNSARMQFADNTSSPFRGAIEYSHGSDELMFYTSGSKRMTLFQELLIGKTADDIATNGVRISANGGYSAFTRNSDPPMYVRRNSSDGVLINFMQDGGTEGSISISGNTTSYNAFSGSHWSRLIDNSKPTILKGTVIETIDEMCDWYRVKFTIAETENVPEHIEEVSVALPSGKSVGDTMSYTHEGITYDNAVIVKAEDEKHPKCKISDTADSKRVYGVHMAWDNDDDSVNDMYVTAVGTYVVRINKDVTVQAGDLLSSNGDGTAKVQDDDIIRSKTIGKVLTNIKQETYDDGSYTVPCALYCG